MPSLIKIDLSKGEAEALQEGTAILSHSSLLSQNLTVVIAPPLTLSPNSTYVLP
jgi:hypothetical protein